MTTKTINCYKYNELSEEAKRRARDWWRRSSCEDTYWSEGCLDDAEQVGELMGIEFRRRNGKAANIYFSGFSSQGDGACFEGTWRFKAGMSKAVRDYAPKDAELHRIARELTKAARRTFYTATARCQHSGHYYHSGCMCVDVDAERGSDVEEDIKEALRDFADWIYRQLEKEYDWSQSDEAVVANIEANEYDFNENGKPA